MKKRFFIFKAGTIEIIDFPISLFAIKEQPKEGFESETLAEKHLDVHNKKHNKKSKDYYMILPIYYKNIN